MGMLDNKTIELVEKSWHQATPLGIDTIGRLFYQRIFEIDVELLALFGFKDEPDMFNSQKFKTHAAKVVNTVGKAVESLRNIDALVPVLKGLGARHVKYGVLQEHYPTIGSALLDVLAAGLKDKFTPEVRDAWQTVVSIIAATMLEGVIEAEKEGNN